MRCRWQQHEAQSRRSGDFTKSADDKQKKTISPRPSLFFPLPFILFFCIGPGTGTTISYEIAFEGYTGAVETLVVDTAELVADSGAVVSAEVIVLEEGTEPLRGDFSLAFRGQETPALSYDVDADEVHLCAQF